MFRFIFILCFLINVCILTIISVSVHLEKGIRIGLDSGEQICEIRLEDVESRIREEYTVPDLGW